MSLDHVFFLNANFKFSAYLIKLSLLLIQCETYRDVLDVWLSQTIALTQENQLSLYTLQ